MNNDNRKTKQKQQQQLRVVDVKMDVSKLFKQNSGPKLT